MINTIHRNSNAPTNPALEVKSVASKSTPPPFPSRASSTNSPRSPLKLFDIAKAEGRPLYTCAPMVRYSKVCLIPFLNTRSSLMRYSLLFEKLLRNMEWTFAGRRWYVFAWDSKNVVHGKETEMNIRFWQKSLIVVFLHVILVSTRFLGLWSFCDFRRAEKLYPAIFERLGLWVSQSDHGGMRFAHDSVDKLLKLEW